MRVVDRLCSLERSSNHLQDRLVQGGFVVHVVDDDNDDDEACRSLAMLLQSFGLVAVMHNSTKAVIEALPSLRLGCLILDIQVLGMDGLARQKELVDRGCRLPIIVMTGRANVGLAVRAMKAGAIDVIEKPYSGENVLQTVTTALSRLADTCHSVAMKEAAQTRIKGLTQRERDVFSGLVNGRRHKAIAHELGISLRTVSAHRANLMERLGCHSLPEAVRVAITSGFVLDL